MKEERGEILVNSAISGKTVGASKFPLKKQSGRMLKRLKRNL